MPPTPKQLSDVIGLRFGRLTVQSESSENYKLICACDCGTIKSVRKSDLKSGRTNSCGCLLRETSSKRATLRNTKHGQFGTKIYNVWDSMMGRCYRPNASGYSNYGGRGIAVCDSWHDFAKFYADMGEPGNLTLDRIDVDKNYCKENCRWATYSEQANNKRNNLLIEFNGKTQPIRNWATELNISIRTLYSRHYAGWAIERMLTTP